MLSSFSYRFYYLLNGFTAKRISGGVARSWRAVVRPLATLFVATSMFCPSAALTQAPKPSPEVVVETTRHDFGEVFAGEELSCSFRVRNSGTAPLELSERKLTGGLDYLLRPQPAFSPNSRGSTIFPALRSRPAAPG